MPSTKTQRLLDLITFLVGRRLPVSVDDIMENVPEYAERWRDDDPGKRESVRRMFERDKEELRALGIPLESVPYRRGGGRESTDGYELTERDFYLPYLRVISGEGSDSPGTTGEGGPERPPDRPPGRPGAGGAAGIPHRRHPAPYSERARVASLELAEEEIRATVDALERVLRLPSFPYRRQARSALAKLAFDLDPEFFRELPLVFVERPEAERVEPLLRDLSGALEGRRRVRFRYHGIYRGEPTEREVEPYGLLFHGGNWYLVGHDTGREDLRVFRLGRIEELEVSAGGRGQPEYAIPEDFDLADLTDREAWALDGDDEEPLEAEVHFEFPTSLQVARNERGTLVREVDGGAQVRRFGVHQVNPFLRWVLSLGGEATVLGPPELVEEFRGLVARTLETYRERSGDA